MELEGSLKAFSLAEVLQFLAMGKLTGILMVRHDHEGIDLVIRQGKIVNSSTLDQARRLGQMLIYRRLIHRSDLDDVLRDQKTTHPDRMLGQLLVERELITADDLRHAIRSQLEEETWELFSWETGDFRFENRPDTEIRNVIVEIEIEPLIIEGTRRIDEWKAIIRSLRGDNTVLLLNSWKPEEHRDLTLTQPEWQVLSYMNGTSTIGSVAARASLGKFETYRILNAFLAAGIVRIKEEETGAEAATAAPADPQEAEKNANGARKGGAGLLNLFGKKRGEVSVRFERNEKFTSPVGLTARFINLVVRACLGHRDFNLAAGDDRFLEHAWPSVIIEWPMADLIKVEGNTVDARLLERYLEFGGVTNVTLRVYEDALEAMGRLYGTVATVFAQRMGERTYRRIVQTFQTDWLAGVQVEQQRRFDFAEFLDRSLPLAQGER